MPTGTPAEKSSAPPSTTFKLRLLRSELPTESTSPFFSIARKVAKVCSFVGGVVSPLLANIVLNRLDWRLHERGFRFARYADDFVIVCQTNEQAQKALTLVTDVLETELGPTLSPEKTKITTYGKGYEFLGFRLSSRSRRMREKSLQKFKAKVRELTIRRNSTLQ